MAHSFIEGQQAVRRSFLGYLDIICTNSQFYYNNNISSPNGKSIRIKIVEFYRTSQHKKIDAHGGGAVIHQIYQNVFMFSIQIFSVLRLGNSVKL